MSTPTEQALELLIKSLEFLKTAEDKKHSLYLEGAIHEVEDYAIPSVRMALRESEIPKPKMGKTHEQIEGAQWRFV